MHGRHSNHSAIHYPFKVSTTHVNQKIRKLLAVGRRFALALLPFFDAAHKNLVVVDLEEKRVVGGCTVPHSKSTTPDISQGGDSIGSF